jgi:hypothetical protein
LSGLANNCYDLRVRRPLKQQISQRMMGIAAKEGLQVDRNAIEMLIESVGNDIRQVQARWCSVLPPKHFQGSQLSSWLFQHLTLLVVMWVPWGGRY